MARAGPPTRPGDQFPSASPAPPPHGPSFRSSPGFSAPPKSDQFPSAANVPPPHGPSYSVPPWSAPGLSAPPQSYEFSSPSNFSSASQNAPSSTASDAGKSSRTAPPHPTYHSYGLFLLCWVLEGAEFGFERLDCVSLIFLLVPFQALPIMLMMQLVVLLVVRVRCLHRRV